MDKKQQTAAEWAAEQIMNMPIHKDYVPVKNMPIPLFKGILIKKTKQGEVRTKGGIIMGGQRAENVIEPNEGIVMAVGPMCSQYVRIGLKYKFSGYVDSYYYHEGEEYCMGDETFLHYVIPDDSFVAHGGYKSEKQVRKEKKLPMLQAGELAVFKRDENEKDKRLDKTKGKTFKLK